MGDYGTLFPLAIGYIAVCGLNPAGFLVMMGIANIATGLLFASDLITSIFTINQEKNNNPYIVVGYNDIVISDESYKQGDYLVQVNYRLLKDLTVEGTVSI